MLGGTSDAERMGVGEVYFGGEVRSTVGLYQKSPQNPVDLDFFEANIF